MKINQHETPDFSDINLDDVPPPQQIINQPSPQRRTNHCNPEKLKNLDTFLLNQALPLSIVTFLFIAAFSLAVQTLHKDKNTQKSTLLVLLLALSGLILTFASFLIYWITRKIMDCYSQD